MKLSVVMVLAVLVLIGYMQTSWAKESAQQELTRTQQLLTSRIYRALSREYSRFGSFLAELDAQSSSPASGPGQVETKLRNILNTYGPKGLAMPLVSHAQYLDTSNPLPAWKQYGSEADASAGEVLPAASLIEKLPDLFMNNQAFFLVGDTKSPLLGIPESYIITWLDSSHRFVGAFTVNSDVIYTKWIEPALAVELKGQTYHLSQPVPSNPAPMQPHAPGNNLQAREFQALSVLLGLDKGGDSEMVLPLFLDADTPPDLGGMIQGPGSAPAQPKPGSAPPVRSQADAGGSPEEPGFHPQHYRLANLQPGFRTVALDLHIVLDSNSPQAQEEYRLALNWFFSIMLLVALGLAFLFLMYQLASQRDQRQREREFVASITHELRTPLTVIKSAGENLSSGIIDPHRTAEYGTLIKDQADRLNRMVEEVLLMSHFVSGKSYSTAPRTVETQAFFQGLQDNLAPLLASRGVGIQWDFAALQPSFMCDTEVLKFILDNLIGNAINHGDLSPAGKSDLPQIRIHARPSIPKELMFVIEDTGRGIPAPEQKKIGKPFFRSERSRAMHEQGSGLGLYLCQRKIENIKGSLTLESPYRLPTGIKTSGCRFTLRIPGAVEKHE